MTITELRKMRANNPKNFWGEWLKKDAKGLAMARIKVSYEDTLSVLRMVKKGKLTFEDGLFARTNHSNLIRRMMQKSWVNELDVKHFIIY